MIDISGNNEGESLPQAKVMTKVPLILAECVFSLLSYLKKWLFKKQSKEKTLRVNFIASTYIISFYLKSELLKIHFSSTFLFFMVPQFLLVNAVDICSDTMFCLGCCVLGSVQHKNFVLWSLQIIYLYIWIITKKCNLNNYKKNQSV